MPTLPVYTPISVFRNSITAAGRGPLVQVADGVLVQIVPQSAVETEDNKGTTPLRLFDVYTYKPAWSSAVLPDIRQGDRLYDPAGVTTSTQDELAALGLGVNTGLVYIVQGVSRMLDWYLKIQASLPRGT